MSGKEVEPFDCYGDILTDRVFEAGGIYYVNDKLISLPESDRIKSRNYHEGRPLVVLQNDNANSNEAVPLITVAPVSSVQKYKKASDLPLKPKVDDVNTDSLLMVGLLQPILKIDVERKIGDISDEKLKQALFIIGEKFGIIE